MDLINHKNYKKRKIWLHSSLLIIFLVCCCFALQAQQETSFILKNSLTKAPIEGAVVNINSLSENVSLTTVSDTKGLIAVPFTPPFVYQIQHLSYKKKTDTLGATEPAVIFLEEINTYLEGIVITGQYEPQSARNSVFSITTLDAERIKAQGAVTLQDVLAKVLNVRFSRDNATGVSGISMQGISGQNVKVLIDGVPVVGRSGVYNEVDLNQINMEDVQRIELVEGPMAVNYGSDALAGVINIISKKDIDGKVNVNVSLHEETVGKEFSLFTEGIHAPSVQIGYKPHDNWYSQLSTRINRFGGWQGESKGRSKAWYPKDQYFIDGLARYEKNDFSIYYKLSHLNESLLNQGNVNNNNPLKDPFALDEEYKAIRWMHQVQASAILGKIKLNSAVAYTDYQRHTRQFNKNILTGEETSTISSEQDTSFYRSLFFRHTAVDLASTDWMNTQLGIEGTFETSGGTKLSSGNKRLADLAFFASATFKIGSKLKVRPGFRTAYNSVFSTIPVPSINLKYHFTNHFHIRLGYGRGFRAPSIRELYHEFMDSNHNIEGNEELEPEYSHNISGEVTKIFTHVPLEISLGGFYNYIDNRITLYTSSGANQVTTYTNLLRFKSTGGTIKARYRIGHFQVSGGFSYTGRYQLLNESYSEAVRKYLFSPELNAHAQYQWQNPRLTFNAFYKYYGKTKNYQLITDENTGASSPLLAATDAYQFFDFNITKEWGKYLSTSLGAKNILNVTSLNSLQTDTAHNQSGAVSISYGRSYFLKLNFHFTK